MSSYSFGVYVLSHVFARRASGLVREATLLDTVLFGIMNNGAAVSVWYYISSAPYLFPGLNQTLTFLLGAFLGIIGFGMMWGFLGAAMPRSGGSYVYNSRIIHPAIGTAVSFANAGFVMTAWIWVLAPWIADPGLPILAGAMGLDPSVVSWWTQPLGMYIIATLANLLGLLVVLFGLRFFFRIQRVLIGWSLIGAVLAAIILSVNSHQTFVDVWNFYAAKYSSLTWEETLMAVNEVFPLPDTWNFASSVGALLPLSWALIYGYVIAFIGGEVKSPRKNIFMGQVMNALLMLIIVGWNAFAIESLAGYKGMHALAYIDNEGLTGYNFPFSTTYLNIAAMLVHMNPFIGFFFGMSFIFADFMWIPFSYIAFSRGLFAWGMDRIGPNWFTDIHPKWHQPVKLLLTEFILGQIGITWYAISPDVLAGFSVEVMQLFSVFGFTAISAMIFPYVKKVRHIWDTSPHKEWKILGLPMCAISGFLTFVLVLTLIWAAFTSEGMEAIMSIWTPIYVVVWVSGLLWYFGWKAYRQKEGIDVTLAYKELAPE